MAQVVRPEVLLGVLPVVTSALSRFLAHTPIVMLSADRCESVCICSFVFKSSEIFECEYIYCTVTATVPTLLVMCM